MKIASNENFPARSINNPYLTFPVLFLSVVGRVLLTIKLMKHISYFHFSCYPGLVQFMIYHHQLQKCYFKINGRTSRF